MIGIRLHRVDGRPTVVVERGDQRWTARELLGRDHTIDEVLGEFDAFVDAALDALEHPPAPSTLLDGSQTLVPTVDRPSVYCAGANFADHVAEMGEEAIVRPYHFVSPATVLSADGASVPRPLGAVQLDWEVELVAVIGRRAFRVPAADALDYVAGYTVGNDISVRGADLMHPIFGIDWTSAKHGDALTAVGPAIVPARYVPDPQRLHLGLTVNGEVRQDSSTDQMLVTVAQQIEAITRRSTLLPGDLILTGTPAGTARAFGGRYLEDGDVMRATIEGIGTLTSTIAPTLHTKEVGG